MKRLFNVALVRKTREWLWRYLPAEIGGTITAVLAALVSHELTDSLAVAAIAGTIGENFGYYGTSCCRDFRQHWQKNKTKTGLKKVRIVTTRTTRDMLVEFGPAELLDSFFVRPSLFYLVPQAISNVGLGFFIAKIMADVVFYALAIVGYEVRKRLFIDFKSDDRSLTWVTGAKSDSLLQ